ncbi:MAG: hypothetical protein IJS65_00620 [Clostridia bacterium]|nr:hypothetical protein [Clostridia bacterium]
MATMEEKTSAFTKLMQEGVITATEFAAIIGALNGGGSVPQKEKTPLEQNYDEVFSKHIINAFKSPGSCKWPPLEQDMIKKGNVKILGKDTECTYIETYIDATNSYGALLRKKLLLVLEDGKITRALEEAQTSGVTLLGMLANAALKGSWTDIVKL